LKAQVFSVLKAHPDYAQWAKDYHPNPAFDLPAYVFMRSSTWPDEIRRSGNKYDHPNWHFIDYPLRPPDFAFEADPNPTNNVLYGIGECEKALANTNADPEFRAAYLSYLVHLIGDLHQPLHCESFFSEAYTNGDRGGNDFYVKAGPMGVCLHAIWDGLLGSSMDPRTQWNYAVQLESKFPKRSLWELGAHSSPLKWSLESRELAIKKGYLNGTLPGSTHPEDAPPLPAGYTKQAAVVAERQAALAGYRLADEIHKYLRYNSILPLLPPNTNSPTLSGPPEKVGVAEASQHYDESMIVTGMVSQVSVRPSIIFINLDESGKNSSFSAVIFPSNAGMFPDVEKLQGQNVEISGYITDYHNKPEIILEASNQIKIVDKK
jgi:hypothetical protein